MPTLHPPPSAEFSDFAISALEQAGQIALEHFRRPMQVANKADDDYDPVTEADRNIEQSIRQQIGRRYPDHGIIGEEYAATGGDREYTWIIDPIDGTRAYVTGFPAWGMLLGLLRDGEPVLGFMHQPYIGETFGGDNHNAWIQQAGHREQIHASATTTLADAVLYATHPDIFDDQGRRRFEALARQTRLMRYGGDCYVYCLLAHGLIDMVVEDSLQPHDILPLLPIIRGAGGIVTDLTGAAPQKGGMIIAAATRPLHDSALAHMGG